MPLQQTSGNSTQDSYGGGVAVIPTYIEQIFSTYLYTGNTSTQTINNGIDLAGKGGLVWIKNRTGGPYDHMLLDTARGTTKYLNSNTTAAESTNAYQLTSFNSNGFTLGDGNYTNNSAATYASWTFRKQPKFFDVVTFTTDASGNAVVPHSLGSVPGCVIIKNTQDANNWMVYHRSLTSTSFYLTLNTTAAQGDVGATWINPTSTNVSFVNNIQYASRTYVAYLFAHNAGGFGLTGTDNVISCGSFTDSGSDQSINLGYEPQYLLVKRTNSTGDWWVVDNMRGMPVASTDATLKPNTSAAEQNAYSFVYPEATGFRWITGQISSSGQDFIYIAIRRGPMKVPTDGTKVFSPVANTVSANNTAVSTGFPVDFLINQFRTLAGATNNVFDRLRGSSSTKSVVLTTQSTASEAAVGTNGMGLDNNTGYNDNFSYWNSGALYTYANWAFSRAPGFFDEVCYTATASTNRRITHNLGVAPELIINKQRSVASGWPVYLSSLGRNNYFFLNQNASTSVVTNIWGTSNPTATDFGIDETQFLTNGATSVAYLFATCPGVSKCGSYTGTGTTQTINCGFTAGARFVLIKRTDSTGNWMTFDTARGMTVLTDPFLSLNSTAAETATLGACTTVTTGFAVNEAILTGINTNGGSYIYFSVA